MKKAYIYPQTESTKVGIASIICTSLPNGPEHKEGDVFDGAPARKLYV